MKNLSPCKECKTRKLKCHATCFKYLAWSNNRLKTMQTQKEKYGYLYIGDRKKSI